MTNIPKRLLIGAGVSVASLLAFTWYRGRVRGRFYVIDPLNHRRMARLFGFSKSHFAALETIKKDFPFAYDFLKTMPLGAYMDYKLGKGVEGYFVKERGSINVRNTGSSEYKVNTYLHELGHYLYYSAYRSWKFGVNQQEIFADLFSLDPDAFLKSSDVQVKRTVLRIRKAIKGKKYYPYFYVAMSRYFDMIREGDYDSELMHRAMVREFNMLTRVSKIR